MEATVQPVTVYAHTFLAPCCGEPLTVYRTACHVRAYPHVGRREWAAAVEIIVRHRACSRRPHVDDAILDALGTIS